MRAMKADPVALLARHLEKHKKSQSDLAKQAGIAEAHVSRYLARLRRPDMENAIRLERATGGEVPALAWAFSQRKAS